MGCRVWCPTYTLVMVEGLLGKEGEGAEAGRWWNRAKEAGQEGEDGREAAATTGGDEKRGVVGGRWRLRSRPGIK